MKKEEEEGEEYGYVYEDNVERHVAVQSSRGVENQRDSMNGPTTKKRKADTLTSNSKSKSMSSKTSSTIEMLKNDSGESYMELSDSRRVTIQTYRGRRLVQIREYYKDKNSGEMRPGKSGIALTEDQWKLLK